MTPLREGQHSILSAAFNGCFVRLLEPKHADKRVLDAEHQRELLPVATAANGGQIARDVDGDRPIDQHLPSHFPIPSELTKRQHDRFSQAIPKLGKIWCPAKHLARYSGAPYSLHYAACGINPAPKRSTFVPILGQASFAGGNQSPVLEPLEAR